MEALIGDRLDAIFGRRSIRVYKPGAVPPAIVRTLLKAAMAAPSAVAKDPWRFVVVQDRLTLARIAEFLPNGKMLAQAALGIVVCGDLEAAHDRQLSYLLQDCSAAIENLLLAAHIEGLGACWLGVHPREDRIHNITRLLGLPPSVIPVSGVAIGWPGEAKKRARATIPPPFITRNGKPQPVARTSKLAVIVLVCGALGFCSGGSTALAGLPLGWLALARIKRSGGRLKGTSLAKAGLCLAGFELLVLGVCGLCALVWIQGQTRALACRNNLTQLGLAVRLYASEHGETLPPADHWCDAIAREVPLEKIFRCPKAPRRQRCSYTFNARVSELNIRKPHPDTVLLFEGKGGWNRSGGSNEMISGHQGCFLVGLVDGKVLKVPPSQLYTLRWEP